MGILVALGGGVGAVARFLAGAGVAAFAVHGFPWPTLAVNVAGSVLIGCVYGAVDAEATAARAFLGIGVCGGFTTFSAFGLDTVTLLGAGRYLSAVLYACASVLLCVAGVYAGMRVAGASSQRAAA